MSKKTDETVAAVLSAVISPAPVAVKPPPILIPDKVDPVLTKILRWKRPHNSDSELDFAKWLRNEIRRRARAPEIMEAGCIVLSVDAPICSARSARATTLFSCHIDTVHTEGGKQGILYDPSFGHILLDRDDKAATCLGADDGAGVWLMLEMIRMRVPGTYVFHRGEERGGIGARAMLEKREAWLSQFECAVAFDRAGTDEVLTHQGGMRCCSDKFANALAEQLNANSGFAYRTSTSGVFTDTKVYRGVIAECANIGVGYENQHTSMETLDYAHLVALRDALVKVKWEALPIDRDPKAADTSLWAKYNRGSWYEDYDSEYGSAFKFNKYEKEKPAPKKPKQVLDTPEVDVIEEVRDLSIQDLVAYCENSPDSVAALLVDLASEVAALREKVNFLKGALR